VIALGFLLRISPQLTMIALLPLPIVSFTGWYFGNRIHHRFESIQQRFADLSARVQESLAGVRVVRAFGEEAHELDTFRVLNEDYRRQNLELLRVSGVFYPVLAFLAGLTALLGLYLGGLEVMAGRITLGEFVAFTVYLAMLNWP